MNKLVKHINKLIVRIAKGNIAALDELYEITGKMLLAMARKYLYDKSYAEDLVSDTYLKIVRGALQFDKRRNGLNWIFKTLHNGAIDYNRRFVTGKEVAADMLCSIKERSDCNIDDWLDSILIYDAMSKLSEDEKQIIYLRYWEGLRLNEIAERLNKSTATAHVIVQKTLDKLKRFIR